MHAPAFPLEQVLPTILVALKASSLAVLQVSFVTASGYVVARLGLLHKDLQENLNALNQALFTPALILIKIAPTSDWEKFDNLIFVPLAFVVFTGVSSAVGFATATIFQVHGNSRVIMACSMAVNSNSLPIALVASLAQNIAALKMTNDDHPDAMLARCISYLVIYSTIGLIWRWSFMVPFLAKGNTDLPRGSENSEWSNRYAVLEERPRRPIHVRIFKAFTCFMTPALWAVLLGILIALIPPVQKAFIQAAPLTAAIDSVGDISIPITLILLGAYFYEPKPEDGSSKATDELPLETRTIWAAVLSRMVFSPIPLYALIATLALDTLVPIFDDPIFIITMFLLAGGPTALTISQLTTEAAPQFKKTVSRILFLNYVFFLLPMTVIGTVLAIVLSATFDVDDGLKVAFAGGNSSRVA